MAQEVVDRAITEYGLTPRNECVTTDVSLIGAKDWTPTMFIKLIQNYGIQRDVRPPHLSLHRNESLQQVLYSPSIVMQVALHLANTYGDRAPDVAKLAKTTGKR